METLMEDIGETVFLGTLNGDHVTILNVVESHNELKITSPPGTRMPLLAGASGRVLLAQLEEKKARELVQKKGLTRYTAKSVTDVKRFYKEVEETKKRGYAIDNEEYLLGVTAVAAPIQTTSLPPAAIWVVMFTPGSHDLKVEKIVQEIQKAAQEVTRLLKERLG